VLGCICSYASISHAQLTFTDLEATARVEASSVNSQTFESLLDEDERTLMGPGSLLGSITANSSANGGSGFARSEYDITQGEDGFVFISELNTQASLGSAFSISANSGAGLTAIFSTQEQTDIAISGAFVLDQPLPSGIFGPLVDIRVQLLGGAGSLPEDFLMFQYSLSSLIGGTDNEIRFIDVATIAPDGEYTLFVQATINAGVGGGLSGQPVDLSGRFTFRLDYLDDDGDGLFNTWEEDGIDFEIDGNPELDLAFEGADPQFKDVFVELDVQEGSVVGPESIDPIVDAFFFAPVENPIGQTGINLHMAVDDLDLPVRIYTNDMQQGYCDVDTQILEQREAYFGTAAERSSPISEEILKAKSLVYRYGVVGGLHVQVEPDGTSSDILGVAEFFGDDFLITVPASPFVTVETGLTIMHELGHTLGLDHGGCDEVNFKPNYFSVMNYMHAGIIPLFPSVWNDAVRYDYSRRALPTLDETALSEPAGIGTVDPLNADRFFFFINESPIAKNIPTILFLVPASSPNGIDWNVDFDKLDEGVSLDVNRDIFDASGELTLLEGHDDWSNLHYRVRGGDNFGQGNALNGASTLDPERGEISIQLLEALNSTPYIVLGDDLPCPADLNDDGELNFFDVSAFLTAYQAMDPVADFNDDGEFNFFDVSAFLVAYQQGCP
jgi:hypothetical protein